MSNKYEMTKEILDNYNLNQVYYYIFEKHFCVAISIMVTIMLASFPVILLKLESLQAVLIVCAVVALVERPIRNFLMQLEIVSYLSTQTEDTVLNLYNDLCFYNTNKNEEIVD